MTLAQVLVLGGMTVIAVLAIGGAIIVILSISGAARFRWFRLVLNVLTGRQHFSADEIKVFREEMPTETRPPDFEQLDSVRELRDGNWVVVWDSNMRKTGPHVVSVERDGTGNILTWNYGPIQQRDRPTMQLRNSDEVPDLRVGDNRHYSYVVEGTAGVGASAGRLQRWHLTVDHT